MGAMLAFFVEVDAPMLVGDVLEMAVLEMAVLEMAVLEMVPVGLDDSADDSGALASC